MRVAGSPQSHSFFVRDFWELMSVPERWFWKLVARWRFYIVPGSLLSLGERMGADKVMLAIMLDHILGGSN